MSLTPTCYSYCAQVWVQSGICEIAINSNEINIMRRDAGEPDGCGLTCARCRSCAGDLLQTGSGGCSAAPPSPPDASSRRSCPSGLPQRRAPWPCNSCSRSPMSETNARHHDGPPPTRFPSRFTSSRTTMCGCRTIWWILGSRFMFFSTYES